MSDFYARAVIGISVDQKKLWKKHHVRAFDHNYSKDVNFCPKTGKKCWEQKQNPIDGYDPNKNMIGKFHLYHGTDGFPVILGFTTTEQADMYGSGHKLKTLKDFDLEEVRIEMKNLLEPLGLWNEDEFGLHAILYCSY